jgi:hypothetical protein
MAQKPVLRAKVNLVLTNASQKQTGADFTFCSSRAHVPGQGIKALAVRRSGLTTYLGGDHLSFFVATPNTNSN